LKPARGRSVVAKTKSDNEIGNQINGQDEIGQRAEQGGADLERRRGIHGAKIGGDQIIHEREPPGDAFELVPELVAHFLFAPREPGTAGDFFFKGGVEFAATVSVCAHFIS